MSADVNTVADASNYSVTRSTRSTHVSLGLAVVAVVARRSVSQSGSTDTLRLAIDIFLYVALAAMWDFLAGYAGLKSIGQQAHVGLGGCLFFALTARAGLSPWASVPLVGWVAAALSVPIAALLFRLRGAYFAIGSGVMAEVFHRGSSLITPLGGGSGMSLPVSVAKSVASGSHECYVAVYCISMALLLGILLLIVLVPRSR